MNKRLRIFAGPNGSGKSSIIKKILNTEVKKGVKLDFGIYINADDIAQDLIKKHCDISKYNIEFIEDKFYSIVKKSGLLSEKFTFERLKDCITIENCKIFINKDNAKLIDDKPYERIAQILADYLRKELLESENKFSFETVFSHKSKVDFIKEATEKGYKVYLYFVSTEHPDINVYRVKEVRVKEKGHDVDEDLIRSRYYRSMNFLQEAAQYCYQVYFFDNSKEGNEQTMFAHFKVDSENKKQWDDIDKSIIPNWFYTYYSKKI